MFNKLAAIWRRLFSRYKSQAQIRRQAIEWALRNAQQGEHVAMTLDRAERYILFWLSDQ